jgi:hypothetical protein
MKNDERYEEASDVSRDHDAAWRERIQRALRDLRSASSVGEEQHQPRARTE